MTAPLRHIRSTSGDQGTKTEIPGLPDVFLHHGWKLVQHTDPRPEEADPLKIIPRLAEKSCSMVSAAVACRNAKAEPITACFVQSGILGPKLQEIPEHWFPPDIDIESRRRLFVLGTIYRDPDGKQAAWAFVYERGSFTKKLVPLQRSFGGDDFEDFILVTKVS